MLIHRLLYEANLLFEDQVAALEADSKTFGTQGSELDFALLVDWRPAEREQGITIDGAHRSFCTDQRNFTKYRVNVNALEYLAAKRLELNEIGVCNIAMDFPITFDPNRDNRDTGGSS